MNYRGSNDTPGGPEDKESDTLPTPEPESTRLEHLIPEVDHTPEPEVKDERPPTPKVEEEKSATPKEEEHRPLTPTEDRQRPLTPVEDQQRPPTPTEEQEKSPTLPARVPTFDDDMSFQYPKYRDDPDAEAHVHAVV